MHAMAYWHECLLTRHFTAAAETRKKSFIGSSLLTEVLEINLDKTQSKQWVCDVEWQSTFCHVEECKVSPIVFIRLTWLIHVVLKASGQACLTLIELIPSFIAITDCILFGSFGLWTQSCREAVLLFIIPLQFQTIGLGFLCLEACGKVWFLPKNDFCPTKLQTTNTVHAWKVGCSQSLFEQGESHFNLESI